ncbi:MAG: response regulator [Planctomycetota bacterium]|jgi:CheY-like chemotaxis protein
MFDVLEQAELAPVAAQKRPMILIVDDDDCLADVLSHRLKQQGFDTVTAETGQSGLAKARSGRPALIVLDLQLPDIDGFTICEQLADSPETCTIPVIILSGTERPDILGRCRAAGGHYYVRKPYDPNVLLILIRQAISETEDWDPQHD